RGAERTVWRYKGGDETEIRRWIFCFAIVTQGGGTASNAQWQPPSYSASRRPGSQIDPRQLPQRRTASTHAHDWSGSTHARPASAYVGRIMTTAARWRDAYPLIDLPRPFRPEPVGAKS